MDKTARVLVGVQWALLLVQLGFSTTQEPVRATPSANWQLGVSEANPSNGLTRRLGGILHPPVDSDPDGVAVKGSPSGDDFVPKDIGNATVLACMVTGVKDEPPYAEAQVAVKYFGSAKPWDYKPVIARRTLAEGGVPRAIEDCRQWLAAAKQRISEAASEQEKAH